MAKFKEPFTLFPRKTKSGKTIYYYQTYYPNGKRSTARSTGKSLRSEARVFCTKLFKDDDLLPQKNKKKILFKDYFKFWWKWGDDPLVPTICPYLKRQYSRNRKPSYANSIITYNKYIRHIKPYFSSMYINEIKSKHIEQWLDHLSEYGLSTKTQIDLLSCLRIMFKEAKRMGDILSNPVLDVEPPIKSKPKKRGILSVSESNKLFDINSIDLIWNGELKAMGAFMVARDTAMRPGEFRALQWKHIHFYNNGDICVDIHQAVDHISHNFKDTKTGAKIDKVPLRKDTAEIINRIYNNESSSENLVFSKDGKVHISDNYLKRRLYKALSNIGITEEERKKRNITPYSFRYLAITRLRQNGISDFVIRSLARHKSITMTDGYTVFNDDESLSQIKELYHCKNRE